MKTIRRKRNCYALLLPASVFAVLWFALRHLPVAALCSGAAGMILLILFIRQNRRLYRAELIRDNPILTMTPAIVSRPGDGQKQYGEETVVSTFGVMVGGKIYAWGYDGVRLDSIEISREKLYLRFGKADEILYMELLHGLTGLREVKEVIQKLLYETGVKAELSGWEEPPEKETLHVL